MLVFLREVKFFEMYALNCYILLFLLIQFGLGTNNMPDCPPGTPDKPANFGCKVLFLVLSVVAWGGGDDPHSWEIVNFSLWGNQMFSDFVNPT